MQVSIVGVDCAYLCACICTHTLCMCGGGACHTRSTQVVLPVAMLQEGKESIPCTLR
eukprot:NODE_3822_length_344_cov_47.955932_g3740_i0.p5 GENE.NODE_3822_length_344_cov_47.955932_g3740_i0~~NODE_3822_length_344_cov_47.955932_g3740_i0.p5  ORF type:complete len:57 (-),score=7.26 NODE_3822_length_344_cov_47.955932_g3740_i0:4-174(-)